MDRFLQYLEFVVQGMLHLVELFLRGALSLLTGEAIDPYGRAGRFKIRERVIALLGSNKTVVFATSGAGAGCQQLIWQIPGISKVFGGAQFPYLPELFDELAGRNCKSKSSLEGAIALAEAMFRKVLQAGKAADDIVAVGASAAVATNRDRRGEDRIHLAVKTGKGVFYASVTLEKGYLDRVGQGQVCDLLLLNAILWGCGLPQVELPNDLRLTSDQVVSNGRTMRMRFDACNPTSRKSLPLMILPDGQHREFTGALENPEKWLVFGGSFNPPTCGHFGMAEAAASASGRTVAFEISLKNADKDGISYDEALKRAEKMRWWTRIVIHDAPLFIDKVRRYGDGIAFLVGADTMVRLLDPKYYGTEGPARIMNEFRASRVKFYVVDRLDKQSGEFLTYDAVVPVEYRDFVVHVPGRWDVSSSEIRAEQEKRVA